MRYRPLGLTRMTVSALTLRLTDPEAELDAEAWRDLTLAALEAGINSFEIDCPSPELLAGAGEAWSGVERRLLSIGLRVRASGPLSLWSQDIEAGLRAALKETRAGYLDTLSLNGPRAADMTGRLLDLLQAAKGGGIVRQLGVAGDDEDVDALLARDLFDVLIHPFNIASGWRERNRIKSAAVKGLGVIACDSFTEALAEAATGPSRPASSFWRRRSDPSSGYGAFEFLGRTADWTAEALCLGYSLTDPSVASVLVTTRDIDHLGELAATPERDLPTGLGAQIEMARFSAPPEGQERRRA